MPTTTTTEPTTGQTSSRRTTTQPTNTPTNQLERSAANRLRTTMSAVRLAFTWLGVRKTLAPEQRTTAARAFHADRELVRPPVLEQPSSLRGHAPFAGLQLLTPQRDRVADLVDDRHRLILLLGCRETGVVAQRERGLGVPFALALLWLRDGRDELGFASLIDDSLGRLPMLVQFPVPGGALVRRVQDRLLEEQIGHGWGRDFVASLNAFKVSPSRPPE